jgi:sugar lactone lactonase YvrE
MPGSMPWEEPKPGIVTVVLPDGSSRQVADDVWFPNGMVVLGEDTLVLAESHADRLAAWTITDSGELVDRRVWADLGPGSAPDGICADAEGAIWYASVPGQRCTRVAEGGEVLDTVVADRGCFSCVLAATTAAPCTSWPTTTAMAAAPTVSSWSTPSPHHTPGGPETPASGQMPHSPRHAGA